MSLYDLSEIETWLTKARLQRYIREAGGRDHALRLYTWNVEICQSLYWPLHAVEIACRNGISTVLKRQFGEDWHLSLVFEHQLPGTEREKLLQARSRSRHGSGDSIARAETILSELTFGFWVSLLARRFEVPLKWGRNIRVAFPSLPFGLARSNVHSRLDGIRRIRNMIAHHEPVFHLDLLKEFSDIAETIGWMSPETARFVTDTSDIKQLLWRRPVFGTVR